MYYQSILDAVGNTPIVKIRHITHRDVYAKAEFLNPGGSIKDRVAKYLIEEAEKAGFLKKGSIILEPSSGNTGIGMAFVGVQKGYRVIIAMPENMSEERKKIIKAFGGELLLTPAEESLQGSIDRAEEMAKSDPRIYIPQQFENPKNPEISPLFADFEGFPSIFIQVGSREILLNDSLMIADVIIVVANPSTSNIMGMEELNTNIYSMLSKDTKMILLINKIEEEGADSDKTIFEKNLATLRNFGKNSFDHCLEVPFFHMLSERIYAFEEEVNKDFVEVIKKLETMIRD